MLIVRIQLFLSDFEQSTPRTFARYKAVVLNDVDCVSCKTTLVLFFFLFSVVVCGIMGTGTVTYFKKKCQYELISSCLFLKSVYHSAG